MTEIKKHALLLSLLATLVVIKFGVVPLLDWQKGIIFENQTKTKRLTKISNILINEDNLKENNTFLNQQLFRVEALFFPFQTESTFKLTQQQAIEALLVKHSLEANNFGWQTAVQLQEYNLIRYQVQLSVSGKFIDLVLWQTELESLSPWYQIEEFNISIKAQKDGVPGTIKNTRVKINLYQQYEDISK